MDEADAWVDRELSRLGVARAGGLRLVRDSNRGRVAVLATSAGPMYLKRPAAFLAPEGAVVACLARFGPVPVPRVVAVDASSGWWLSHAFEGVTPVRDEAGLRLALASLAELQVWAVDRVDEVLAAGCPDHRVESLSAAFRELFREGAATGLLGSEESAAAPELTARLTRCCAEVAAFTPASVAHGDLTPWNLARTPGGVVLFDWANAFVGAPFLDCVTLLAGRPQDEWDRLANIYLRSWRASRPVALDPDAMWQRMGAIWGATFALVADRHRRALSGAARDAAAKDVRFAVRWCGRRLGMLR
jgi:hypothetical protein